MLERDAKLSFESAIQGMGTKRALTIAGIVGAEYPEVARDIVEIEITMGKQPGTSRLDVVQGDSEARTELYPEVQRVSTGAVDAVMRQEFGQSSELGSEAGPNGGGNW